MGYRKKWDFRPFFRYKNVKKGHFWPFFGILVIKMGDMGVKKGPKGPKNRKRPKTKKKAKKSGQRISSEVSQRAKMCLGTLEVFSKKR